MTTTDVIFEVKRNNYYYIVYINTHFFGTNYLYIYIVDKKSIYHEKGNVEIRLEKNVQYTNFAVKIGWSFLKFTCF